MTALSWKWQMFIILVQVIRTPCDDHAQAPLGIRFRFSIIWGYTVIALPFTTIYLLEAVPCGKRPSRVLDLE